MAENHGSGVSASVIARTSQNAAAARRIVLAGWYGKDNAGDEAILHQFMEELPPSEKLHLCVFAHNRERLYAQFAGENVEILQHHRLTGKVGMKHLLRGRARPMLAALRACDVLVIGGGSLIHDNSGLRSLLPVIDDIFIAKYFGRKVWLYAVGIGPLRGRLARWLAAKALRKCDRITVRDEGSRVLLLELGIAGEQITVVKDPAFRLRSEPPCALRMEELESGGKLGDRVGVFLKDALGLGVEERDRLVRWLAGELDDLHRRHGLSFVLLPMMTHPEDDDRLMERAVRQAMECPDAVQVMTRLYTPEELMFLAGQFHFNIAIRLHAAIFSLAQSVPAVAIDYDPKVGNLMRDFGLAEYLVGMMPPQPASLVAATERLMSNHGDLTGFLRAGAPLARQEAGRFFGMLRSELGIPDAAATPPEAGSIVAPSHRAA